MIARYIDETKLKNTLPMHRTSTQHSQQETQCATIGPKESTVNFLKQFARVYSCSNPKNAELSAMILN